MSAEKLTKLAPLLAEPKAAESVVRWRSLDLLGALNDARQAVQRRAASKFGKGRTHLIYGGILDCAGYPDAAFEQFRLAENLSPTDPAIQMHLGLPFFVRRQFDQALKQFQKAIDLEPRQAGAYYWQGRIYEEKGDFEKAIQEFKMYDQIGGQQDNLAFYEELRQAAKQGGTPSYWQKHLDRELNSVHPDTYSIARGLARLGKTDEAYRQLDEASKNGKVNAANLVFDLCWDRHDARFQPIARKASLNTDY